MELLDETAIKQTYTGALMAIQTSCLGALHGEQSLTVGVVCWYSRRILFGMFQEL